MAEEGFIQMYVRDFTLMAARAETGQDVEAALTRRVREARDHAVIMDARKTPGHLDAVIERVREESQRKLFPGRGPDTPEERQRRGDFLTRVADMLAA